ncbi:MAG TPA: SRPBCC family protein [Candidatus Dormibacteraeota bacterium]
MIRAELKTRINKPAEVVFDYVADFDTLPSYDRYVQSARRTSDGPIGVGSTWTHDRTQGPQKITAPIKLVEYERPRRFVMESGSGGFAVRSTMTFAPADGATDVTEVLEMNLRGFVRIMQPLIARQVPKQSMEVHERMKQVIEQLPEPA